LSKTLETNLTEGSVLKQLIKFAIPLLIANILQSLYSTVDMIIVGNFADSAGLSAVSIGGQIMMLITNAGFGLTMGGQIIIAQYTGARDREGQLRTIGTTVSFVALLSLCVTVLGLMFYRPILSLMNTPAESLPQARQYLFVSIIGIIFIMGYNVVCCILRALGDSKRPMVFVGIATVVNIICDLVFVAGLKLGALGAAIATVGAQAVSFVCAAVYLYKHRDIFVFDFKKDSFRIMKDKLKMILKIGIPFAIQFSIISLSVMFIVSMINGYGVAASAAYGVGGKIDNFAMMPYFAIESAASTMVGQCIGAGRKDRVQRVVRFTMLVNMVMAVIEFVIIQVFPEFFLKIFNQDPAVIEYGVLYLRIVTFSYFAFAGMTAYNAVVMGVGNATLSLIGSILDGVVLRLTLACLFTYVFDWGMTGILLATTLSPFGVTLVSGIYYHTGMWKKREIIHGD